MQRKMVSVQARVDRQQATSISRSAEMLRSLARPDVAVMRSTIFSGTSLEPHAVAQAIESSKEAANQVDMSLEMVDIEALDTGKYHAMVIQDPNDKRNIKGFFHFSQAQSVTMRNSDRWNDIGRHAKAIAKLVEAVNRYTQIRCDVSPVLTFNSAELFKTPFVLTCTRYPFELVPSEAGNLGRYLLSGGFLMTDASYHSNRQPGLWALHTMIIQALATQGLHEDREYTFEKLPNSHTLYHCYFDFPSGPPTAGDHIEITRKENSRPYDYLEAVEVEGRVLVIESKKWYCNPWADWWPPDYYGTMRDPKRQLQFGVNLIVFALTQEGSITNRVMDSVRY
jgi:hypothetical protein